MSERLTPAFQGEVQFRRYSDTSTQGAQIVLALADRDELSTFIGKEGKRFMAVLVEVGDDEQPVQPEQKIGPLGYWLVLRCNEPEFHRWLEAEVNDDHPVKSAEDAARVVKDFLGVESRKQIDGNPAKERQFHEWVRGPYSRWLLRRGVTA